MARWLGTGGSYRTIQRFFATVLPWDQLFWVFFRTRLHDSDDLYLLGGDETVVSKAEKKTYGLDRFFSSLVGKPVPGFAFFTLSLISVKQRHSFPIQVAQLFRARGEAASASDSMPPPVEPTPQHKPGSSRKDVTPTPIEPAPKRNPGRSHKDTISSPVEPALKCKPGRSKGSKTGSHASTPLSPERPGESAEVDQAQYGAPCHARCDRSRREPRIGRRSWGRLNNLASKDKGESNISETRRRLKGRAGQASSGPYHTVKAGLLEVQSR